MHQYKIIHFDIKQGNIMFSQYFNKYIYLDFGLSEIIKESPGNKSLFNFRGTIDYCSSEMLNLFQTG